VKWKLEIEMKLLEKNGIRIEIEFFFKMEITLELLHLFAVVKSVWSGSCCCTNNNKNVCEGWLL